MLGFFKIMSTRQTSKWNEFEPLFKEINSCYGTIKCFSSHNATRFVFKTCSVFAE